jgi:hypothetical protein
MNPSVQNSQLSTIYNTLNSLNMNELDAVMEQILGLRKQKTPNVLSVEATNLLKKINIAVPSAIQKRYDKLLRLKQKESLSDTEYEELLTLTSHIEHHDNRRLVHLIALAKYQNQSLDDVILSLGIKSRVHVV